MMPRGARAISPSSERGTPFAFAEYTPTALLHQGAETVILRAVRNADHAKVVLKSPRSNFPTARALAKLRHEHALLTELAGPGIVPVLALARSGARCALVMEDVGLASLDQLSLARLDLGLVVRIVLAVLDALQRAHQRRIVHKDIKPHNILVGTDPLRVYLIDWGIASRLGGMHKNQDGAQGVEEGTIAYVAPEQIGLVDRPIDGRTDLYSLGVTFYELLTGRRPFTEEDPNALVRSHLTRTPTPPDQVDPRVPRQISSIVMKLLAKSADERYASARGLGRDLLECLTQWEQSGHIEPFPLGRSDPSSDFRVPQKLYGREAELADVLAAYRRAQRGAAELLLVSGYGGVGKSSLVREARATMRLWGARAVAGKFEQFRDAVPYTPLVQAIGELVRQILAEPEDAVLSWGDRLERALGQNAGVLTQLVPRLESLIGPKLPGPALGPIEAESRFHLAMQQFVSVFATAEHPLVLFLDDLQWAEPASLKLLDRLLTDPERGHLLIIGAYRDHDQGALELLTRTVDGIAAAGGNITRIQLGPLGLPDLNRLLADTMHTTPAQVMELGEEIHRKTEGNPFFLGQLLTSLVQDGLIAFDADSEGWAWDLRAITQRTVTSSIAELVAQRLGRLRPATRELLKLGAALGAEFDHGTLAQLAGQSIAACARGLWDALAEGLVIPLHDDHRLLVDMDEVPRGPSDEASVTDALHVTYRFLHDRVQEVAYALLDEADRPELHLRIARLLRARSGGSVPEEGVFTIVDHVNIARSLLHDPVERLEAAQLNLRAGRRARASVAFEAAKTYLSAGFAYLPDDAWEEAFELSFALRIEYAELAFLGGDFATADALFDELLERSRSPLVQGEVHALRIRLYPSFDRYRDALRVGRLALASLGAPLPDTAEACQAALAREIEGVKARLAERTTADIIQAPRMTDPRLKLIAKILLLMDLPAGAAGPEFSALISCRQVLLSLDEGPSELSAYGYASCALMMLRTSGRSREAEQLIEIAVALNERYPSPEYTSKVSFVHAGALAAFRPLPEAAACYEHAAEVCLQHGDVPFFQYSLVNSIILFILSAGAELEPLAARLEHLKTTAQRVRAEMVVMIYRVGLQVIAALRGKTRSPCSIEDDHFDEGAFLADARAKGMGLVLACHWGFKVMLSCVQGAHEAALPLIEEAGARNIQLGNLAQSQIAFYLCLHLCALLDRAAPPDAERYRALLERSHALVIERRALCEKGWRCLDVLIAAERERLLGHEMEAQRRYNQAIHLAQQDGLLHVFALGNELHGRFSLNGGFPKIARVYLDEAHQAWLWWGASAKASALMAEFPNYVALPTQPRGGPTVTTTTRATSTAILQGVLFDLGEAMRAAHSISSEIAGERVIERFLRASCASAAAQRAFVILVRDDELQIAGRLTMNPDMLRTSPVTPLAGTAELAESVVRFVAHSQEAVALSSAEPVELFLNDPYIRDHHPKSLLCLPLIHQSRLVGVWYAESSAVGGLRRGSFELLQMLASQAASALENARLYEQVRESSEKLSRVNDYLEAEVAKRTAEVREANKRLVQLEREATEVQMAGGFAHEMRNALASAKLALNAVYSAGGRELWLDNHATLRALRARMPEDQTPELEAMCARLEDNDRRLQRIMDIVNRAVERGILVTNVILEYSQLGRERPGGQAVRLRPVVESILAEVAHDASAHGIAVQLDIAPDLAVRGNRAQLSSMLKHLIQNGREALIARQDPATRELRIDAMEEADRWVLRVSDTGIGIDPEDQNQIFVPFFSTRPPTGIGLGLAIVKKLVRLYHGTITFETELGRGTTFTIALPIQSPLSSRAFLDDADSQTTAVDGQSPSALHEQDDPTIVT